MSANIYYKRLLKLFETSRTASGSNVLDGVKTVCVLYSMIQNYSMHC